jgi:hypothetical protein
MTPPRRRILRPAAPSHNGNMQRATKLRDTLARERTALHRWMSRLRRAFHIVERQQARIARLENNSPNSKGHDHAHY